MQPRSPAVTVEIIGREHELAALRASLDTAIDGTAGIVLLAGEPGIGKTRLGEELAAEAGGKGCRVLWGRCWDGEGAPAFWPWIQIIRAHLRDHDRSDLRGELGAGAATIAQLVTEIRDLLPDLTPPPTLEPAQARFRLFDGIAAFLANIARDRPLVLILDDLHAADVPSLLLLRFLGQLLAARPFAGSAMPRLLVVGAYRAGDVGRGHPLVQTLAEQFMARFPTMATVRSAVALIYAELGRGEEARREFERLAADDFGGLPRAEGWFVTLIHLAEVCTLLGDTARAATLIELVRPYAGRYVTVGMGIGFNGAVSHYLGLLSATLGRWEEAGAHFAGALTMHTRMGARARVAWTAAAYAAALIAGEQATGSTAAPQLTRARELLVQARAIAQELGMARVLEDSERQLAGINARPAAAGRSAVALPAVSGPPCPGGLTPRETEVLNLLTTGATNQEIADALVVSVRTVERHLLHVYGKIGARRRADAVAYALRQGVA